MMPFVTVKAVIFDWGGTLTPWHAIDHETLWRTVCTPHFPGARTDQIAAAICATERELWQATERSHTSATLAQVLERADPFVEVAAPVSSERPQGNLRFLP